MKVKHLFARIIFNIILTLDFKPPVIQGKKPRGTVPEGKNTSLLTVGIGKRAMHLLCDSLSSLLTSDSKWLKNTC